MEPDAEPATTYSDVMTAAAASRTLAGADCDASVTAPSTSPVVSTAVASVLSLQQLEHQQNQQKIFSVNNVSKQLNKLVSTKRARAADDVAISIFTPTLRIAPSPGAAAAVASASPLSHSQSARTDLLPNKPIAQIATSSATPTARVPVYGRFTVAAMDESESSVSDQTDLSSEPEFIDECLDKPKTGLLKA